MVEAHFEAMLPGNERTLIRGTWRDQNFHRSIWKGGALSPPSVDSSWAVFRRDFLFGVEYHLHHAGWCVIMAWKF